MTIALIRSPDAPESLRGCQSGAPAKPPRKKRPRWTPRPRPLSRDQLDGRLASAKAFDRLAADIASDLGGIDQMSWIERTLVEAYCGAYISLANLNARITLGQAVDLGELSGTASAMVRIASRLGISRRARDVTPTPTVEEYAEYKKRQREAAVVADGEAT